MLAQVALAAGLAGLTFAGVTASAVAVTQRLDPSLASIGRNRTIAGAAAILGGAALAAVAKQPMLGAGVAAGAVVAMVGSPLAVKLTSLLAPKPKTTVPVGAVYGNISQVYGNISGMGEYAPQLGAYQAMGEVYGNIGDLPVQPPWVSDNPFQ